MPVDLDNTTTWARVAILSVAAVVLPLIRPRTHVPVDPLNPISPEHVHPEQTAPWLFYVFYEFMYVHCKAGLTAGHRSYGKRGNRLRCHMRIYTLWLIMTLPMFSAR